MAISVGGLGNGVDFGQVVSELAKVQRLPIDALTAKKTDLQTKLTDYGALGNKLLALMRTGFGGHAVTSSPWK